MHIAEGAIRSFPFFVIPLQLHLYRLWLKSRYKCFEEFDRPIRGKNFTNLSIKKRFKASLAALLWSYPQEFNIHERIYARSHFIGDGTATRSCHVCGVTEREKRVRPLIKFHDISSGIFAFDLSLCEKRLSHTKDRHN